MPENIEEPQSQPEAVTNCEPMAASTGAIRPRRFVQVESAANGFVVRCTEQYGGGEEIYIARDVPEVMTRVGDLARDL